MDQQIVEKHEKAISEIVGTLILSALIVIVISIIAISFLSQEPVPEIPALRIDLAEKEEPITLIHRGGDTLYRDKTRIMVDGIERTTDFKTSGGADWTTFSTGDWIIIPGSNKTGANIQIIHTAPEIPTLLFTITGVRTPLPDPPIANFTADITSGLPPLTVQFTDLSTGLINSWSWLFGDGSLGSIEQNPEHTYIHSGKYPVLLTVSNTGGSDTELKFDYIHVLTPSQYIVQEGVGIYGTKMIFAGNLIIGINMTLLLTSEMDTEDINRGAGIHVSKIYIDADMILSGGSTSLGSPEVPDKIVINGDLELWNGRRNIHGDVYVNGDFALKDAIIHNNVYVNGSLTLGWKPTLYPDTNIYYTGTITHPANYDQNILAKCHKVPTVPTESIPTLEIPELKSPLWYEDNGYVSSGQLANNLKIYSSSYTSTLNIQAENVVIIAHNGDISLTNLGGRTLTGILFAPNGRITFEGQRFEGIAIARDGFYVTSGGTTVVFRSLTDFFADEEDWPFV